MKTYATILLAFLWLACNEASEESTPAITASSDTTITTTTTEPPKSIYGALSLQEIIDSLYTDTLRHRDYFDSTRVDTFYLHQVHMLVRKIEADGNDSTTLFPEIEFDEVTASDAWVVWTLGNYETFYGPAKTLSQSEADQLLQIVNNPLNFSWGECGTWTPSCQFRFYLEDELVRTLNVGCSWQLRTDFEKVKFGMMKDFTSFNKLCDEIGLKNE